MSEVKSNMFRSVLVIIVLTCNSCFASGSNYLTEKITELHNIDRKVTSVVINTIYDFRLSENAFQLVSATVYHKNRDIESKNTYLYLYSNNEVKKIEIANGPYDLSSSVKIDNQLVFALYAPAGMEYTRIYNIMIRENSPEFKEIFTCLGKCFVKDFGNGKASIYRGSYKAYNEWLNEEFIGAVVI